nr:putative ribonuclease H-like domain-containing protein [Tanacetum cinerariifolium]
METAATIDGKVKVVTEASVRRHLKLEDSNGGCQFLGKRLISWQRKKKTVVANSTTKAEYAVAANYRGQVQQRSMVGFGEMI